jgi:replicative DNA helicase
MNPDTYGRVPPYDKTAEEAVLGAVLLNPRCLAELRPELPPEAFYVESHRRIFLAMLALDERGAAIDHVTLGTELITRGDLEKIGGPLALENLTDAVATVANFRHYAQIVNGKAALRGVIYAAQQVVAEAFGSVEDVGAFMLEAQKLIADATAATLTEGHLPTTLDSELLEAIHYLEQQGTPPGVIPVSIGEVDNYTGGIWPGMVTVIAGRPGMGKSAFLLNVAFNAAKAGKRVLFFSLEDTRFVAALRLLARLSDMDLQALTLRRVREEQWRQLAAGAAAAYGLPLYMEDTAGLTTQQMHRIAAAHQAQHGLDLVIVDHLDEAGDTTGENETANTSARARGLRNLAKNLHVPMLLAHQLNRDLEKRADKRPALSDLRQSGVVEAVARAVWFLYRPFVYSGDTNEEHALELIVAKSNHGRTGTIRLWCDMSRMYMRGHDANETPPQRVEQRELRPVNGRDY